MIISFRKTVIGGFLLLLLLVEYIVSAPQRSAEYTRKSASRKVRRISRADAENSKFLGAYNQEASVFNDVEQKTLRKFKRRRNRYNRRCSNYRNIASQPEARFLWDINIYHIHETPGNTNCEQAGYADDDVPLRPGFLQNFLSLFVPGVIQSVQYPNNQLPIGAGTGAAAEIGLESNPGLDPIENSFQRPTPRPIMYDSQGAPPLTPSEIVGGVATTVNDIIQRLTGNTRPVYRIQSPYRSKRANQLENSYIE